MGSLLSLSFFITKNMKTQLHEGPVYGTLPVLYVFLARTGKTIHDVSFVESRHGRKFPSRGGRAGRGKNSANGDTKKSAAQRRSQRRPRGQDRLFRRQRSQADALLFQHQPRRRLACERSGFLAFCAKLGAADSFIKSASYLLHSGGFSKVRDLLLDRSATVLQDDSGIPLAYFDPKKWRLQPFGRYIGPIDIFGHSYQSRMAELFRNSMPSRSTSGSAIGGGTTNRTCCWRRRTRQHQRNQELTPPLPTDRYLPGRRHPSTRKKARSGRSPKSHRKRVESETTGYAGLPLKGCFPVLFDCPPEGQPLVGQNGDIVVPETCHVSGGGTVANTVGGPTPQAIP